jgi:hypothetical protein
VKIASGIVKKGFDPEMEEQIINDIQWFNCEQILEKEDERFLEGLVEMLAVNCS